jgi:hypothetical protein
MKRNCLLLAVLLSALLPAAAQGATSPAAFVPSGNSAANEYVEVVPTAGGTVSTRPMTQHSSGGSLGASGESSPLAPSVQSSLGRQGKDGRRAAAFARATAPASVRRGPHRNQAAAVPATSSSGGGGGPGGGAGGLLRAVTGSGTSGGLGSLLPIALGLSALFVGVAALRRHRTS